MKMQVYKMVLAALVTLNLVACATNKKMEVSSLSIEPGTKVNVGGSAMDLYSGRLEVGDDFNKILDSTLGLGLKPINSVSVVNIVPSIDTPVCEEQSHILGENRSLKKGIQLISISRDLPMAQNRFAKEAKLENIKFFSDYKTGEFGKKTGLMIKGKELHARAVLVTDAKGIVRYIQVVDDVVKLPDMQKAFAKANELQK